MRHISPQAPSPLEKREQVVYARDRFSTRSACPATPPRGILALARPESEKRPLGRRRPHAQPSQSSMIRVNPVHRDPSSSKQRRTPQLDPHESGGERSHTRAGRQTDAKASTATSGRSFGLNPPHRWTPILRRTVSQAPASPSGYQLARDVATHALRLAAVEAHPGLQNSIPQASPCCSKSRGFPLGPFVARTLTQKHTPTHTLTKPTHTNTHQNTHQHAHQRPHVHAHNTSNTHNQYTYTIHNTQYTYKIHNT